MRRRIFTLASAVSLVLWIAWLILNFYVTRRNHSDPDHSWYYLGVVPVPRRFLWLVRYSLLIWCVLGVLPAYNLIVGAYRRWRSRRLRPGFCVGCHYNLTDNTSGVCPECRSKFAGGELKA
jgi:hypothetical protein